MRTWRQRRRMSQLALAGEADISTPHLSYVETGRANPSREMVLRLAARLDVPLRERNSLRYPRRDISMQHRHRPLESDRCLVCISLIRVHTGFAHRSDSSNSVVTIMTPVLSEMVVRDLSPPEFAAAR